jgi:hypothetical protein
MDLSYRRTIRITRDASTYHATYHATVVQDLVKEPNKNELLHPTSSITLPTTRPCYPPNPPLLPPWRRSRCTQPPKKVHPAYPLPIPSPPGLAPSPPSLLAPPLPPKNAPSPTPPDFLADFFEGRWASVGWQCNALKTMRYWHPDMCIQGWRGEKSALYR